MKYRLAALGAFAAIGIGYAVAQILPPSAQVISVNPTTDLFLDVVNGAPAAPDQFATSAAIDAAPGTQYVVPVTAFTIQVNNPTTYLFLNPAGTLATGTITFPATPSDGQHLCIWDTQTQTAVTIAAATGTSLSGTTISALTASTQYCWRFVKPTATWYYTTTG